jgi:hypothetical protein
MLECRQTVSLTYDHAKKCAMMNVYILGEGRTMSESLSMQ